MKPKHRRQLQALWSAVYPYLKLTHLHHPMDIPLILLPGLWASWTASGGDPSLPGLLWLLLSVLFMRSLLLMVREVLPGIRKHRPKNWPALRAGLLAIPLQQRVAIPVALGILLLLGGWHGWPVLLMLLLVVLVAAIYEYLRRKTYLGELLLALGLALIIPAAYLGQGVMPDKTAGLLGVAAVLFIVAYRVQWAVLHLTQHVLEGDKSLAMLFGRSERLPIALLQFATLFALHMAGGQADFAPHYTVGLLAALGLSGYQQWLMAGGSRSRLYAAYLSNIWFAIAIFAGIAFHYLCLCTVEPA